MFFQRKKRLKLLVICTQNTLKYLLVFCHASMDSKLCMTKTRRYFFASAYIYVVEWLKGLDKNELERLERVIFVDIGDIKACNEVLNELLKKELS